MFAMSTAITLIVVLLFPFANCLSVSVWDGVIGAEQQRALHGYASKVGLEHKCFSRPLAQNSDGNNIIERTLDAILTEIESNSGNKQEKKP